jgi:hypothetical protein
MVLSQQMTLAEQGNSKLLSNSRQSWRRDHAKSQINWTKCLSSQSDRSSLYDPLARLAGDVCDQVEVGVVVQDGEALYLGGGSDE